MISDPVLDSGTENGEIATERVFRTPGLPCGKGNTGNGQTGREQCSPPESVSSVLMPQTAVHLAKIALIPQFSKPSHLAVLFQPFFKLSLIRVIWNIVDVVVVGLLLVIFFNTLKGKK